jgi:hypothetical protein
MALHTLNEKFLALTVLLLGATLAFGQSNTRVTVQVRPEMQMTLAASNVLLAVRLAPSVQAQVWSADSCAAAPANAVLVTQSGRIQIPLASLGTTLGTGSMVCAASTDGALSKSLNLNGN